jgi:hypothetical protein
MAVSTLTRHTGCTKRVESRTRAGLGGVSFAKSSKQKIVTKSSTEAELIAPGNIHPELRRGPEVRHRASGPLSRQLELHRIDEKRRPCLGAVEAHRNQTLLAALEGADGRGEDRVHAYGGDGGQSAD